MTKYSDNHEDYDGETTKDLVKTANLVNRDEAALNPHNLHIRGDINVWSSQAFLPPPDLLAEYNRVIPNLGKDITEEWKKETALRRKLAESDSNSEKEGRKRGQYFSLFFSIMMIGAAAYLAIHGQTFVATSLVVGNVAIVASNLLWQKNGRR